MSRGKPTAGGAIACRLPIAEDKIFREKAKAEGMSPGAKLRQIALESIRT